MAKVTKVEGKDVNQGTLVKLIAEETGYSQNNVSEVLSALVNVIPKLLGEGKKVTIRNLFSLDTYTKEAHVGRNPQTGEKVQVPKKVNPKASFSGTFKAKLNSKK